jgi:general stress protein 26
MNNSNTDHDVVRTLDDLVTGTPPVAMVMTMVGDVHSSRPVTVAEVSQTHLSFLVSASAAWVEAVNTGEATLHVTLANDSHTSYLSLNGTGSVDQDEAIKRRLWAAPANAWFDGPDDPDLAVLRFEVEDGRFWDGPDGPLGRGIAMVRAALTGSDRGMGTSGNVSH